MIFKDANDISVNCQDVFFTAAYGPNFCIMMVEVTLGFYK